MRSRTRRGRPPFPRDGGAIGGILSVAPRARAFRRTMGAPAAAHGSDSDLVICAAFKAVRARPDRRAGGFDSHPLPPTRRLHQLQQREGPRSEGLRAALAPLSAGSAGGVRAPLRGTRRAPRGGAGPRGGGRGEWRGEFLSMEFRHVAGRHALQRVDSEERLFGVRVVLQLDSLERDRSTYLRVVFEPSRERHEEPVNVIENMAVPAAPIFREHHYPFADPLPQPPTPGRTGPR